jgi:hypothetical protein
MRASQQLLAKDASVAHDPSQTLARLVRPLEMTVEGDGAATIHERRRREGWIGGKRVDAKGQS